MKKISLHDDQATFEATLFEATKPPDQAEFLARLAVEVCRFVGE